MTRGLRLCNPGNIEKGDPWQGLAVDQPDSRFCTFSTMAYGWRAMAVLLIGYSRRGLRTVREIISRWAPPNENNTAAYIAAVAEQTGVAPDDIIDVTDPSVLEKLMQAIGTHENGTLPQAVIDAIRPGMTLAGVRDAT